MFSPANGASPKRPPAMESCVSSTNWHSHPRHLSTSQPDGSFEGWCEVFPNKKKCIYVRAYNRLKPYGEEESLKEGYTPPRNWALDQISSWANYFLGRDHHSQK